MRGTSRSRSSREREPDSRFEARIGENASHVDKVAVVIVIVLFAVPLAIVGAAFIWAAIRDGQEDRAVQARLGIRRRTRLGR
jgi:hypothetical protein